MSAPLVVLIGGATGTGKSTVATELAHGLGIHRVASTDLIRQTMRALYPAELMPSIHYSSFDAAEAAPHAEDPLVDGFLEQSRRVLVGAHAAVERALHEGWSMVLEGVHLVPGLLPAELRARVVECVLRIEDETAHAQHFFARDVGGTRPSSKYLDRFAEIRRLQEVIVDRAFREGVPVIDNDSAQDAAARVAELVPAWERL